MRVIWSLYSLWMRSKDAIQSSQTILPLFSAPCDILTHSPGRKANWTSFPYPRVPLRIFLLRTSLDQTLNPASNTRGPCANSHKASVSPGISRPWTEIRQLLRLPCFCRINRPSTSILHSVCPCTLSPSHYLASSVRSAHIAAGTDTVEVDFECRNRGYCWRNVFDRTMSMIYKWCCGWCCMSLILRGI